MQIINLGSQILFPLLDDKGNWETKCRILAHLREILNGNCVKRIESISVQENQSVERFKSFSDAWKPFQKVLQIFPMETLKILHQSHISFGNGFVGKQISLLGRNLVTLVQGGIQWSSKNYGGQLFTLLLELRVGLR